MDSIIKILQTLRPGIDWAAATGLIDDGLLDSFDVITLIGELEAAFSVRIALEHIEPENFNSVAAIASLLRGLGAEL